MTSLKRTKGRPTLDKKGVATIGVVLPVAQVKRLRKQAKNERTTLSEIIRRKLAA